MSLDQQYSLALLEAQQSQLRARHYETRIAAGSYKLRTATWGTGIALTEAELQQDEIAIMNCHIDLAQEYIAHAKGLLNKIKENEERDKANYTWACQNSEQAGFVFRNW